MSLDIAGKPERDDTSATGEDRAEDEALTREVREVLGNLALNAETHIELGEAFAGANRTLTVLVERHPEFEGPSSELRAKMTQLENRLARLGGDVMRYSLAYEDATMAGAKLNRKQAE